MRHSEEKPYSGIKWETVRKMYGPKMIKAMHTLSVSLKADMAELNPSDEWEMDADSYSVVLCCKPSGREPFDISFSICESTDYEGIEGGYTFRVDVVEDGGLILGEFSPYNYTEEVWCKSLSTIKERFALFIPILTEGNMVEYLAENVCSL